MQNKLQECGQQLVAEVRDEACEFLQRVLSGLMSDSTSKVMYEEFRQLDQNAKNFVEKIVVAAVDACFARFLNFFDAHGLPLTIKTSDKQAVNIQAMSDGLVGELYSDEGWLTKYSRFKNRISVQGR